MSEEFDAIGLVRLYYNGCSAGDVEAMTATLHPDVVHFFLKPNIGSAPVRGRDHLARYWRKVAGLIEARWVVDNGLVAGDEVVIEWTLFWRPRPHGERLATRGAEWFVFRDGLIAEIRSYYQQGAATSELDGFPYAERLYSVPGTERSRIHPEAERFGPVTMP